MIEIKKQSDKKEPDYFTKIFEKEGEAKVVKKESEKKNFSVWQVLKNQLVRGSRKKAQTAVKERVKLIEEGEENQEVIYDDDPLGAIAEIWRLADNIGTDDGYKICRLVDVVENALQNRKNR